MAVTDAVRNPSGDAEDPDSLTTVQDYLERDSKPVPAELLERGDPIPDDGLTVPTNVFTSPDHARDEIEQVWFKTWQAACRERDIPEPGDFIEYSIADQSIVIIRDLAGDVHAVRNACSHRGTQLISGEGTTARLVCPFHSWTYGLDGSLEFIPCRWDFPHVDEEKAGLTRYPVALWNGFVFINLDVDAAPFEEFIGPVMPRHFAKWPMGNKVKAAHVAQIIESNWKVALAAFLEIYHPFIVHPQVVTFAGDINAQYDAWGSHGRMIGPMAVPNPILAEAPPEQQIAEQIIDAMVAHQERARDEVVEPPLVEEGGSARAAVAEWVRVQRGRQNDRDYSDTSDSEMIDVIQYFVFPNLVPWGGASFPWVYRVRPYGYDPDRCIWEVMMLLDQPEDSRPVRDVAVHWLEPGAPWATAEELGGLGPIIDQDIANLSRVQRGLHSKTLDEVSFSRSQEVNVRRLHRNLAARMKDQR